MAAVDKQHLFDQVAADLSEYVESMADMLADSMQEGGRAPFAAKLTHAQQEEYYVEKYAGDIYNPDGTPNEDGRAKLVQMFGPDGFASIARAVIASRALNPPVLGPLSYPVYGPTAQEEDVMETPPVRAVYLYDPVWW